MIAELAAVTLVPVVALLVMLSDGFVQCCEEIGNVLIYPLLPGILLGWFIAGGPHSSSMAHLIVGVATEFVGLWVAVRLAVRALRRRQNGGA